MSQFFASGASVSTSVLPMNIQDWFPLGLTDLISLLSKGLSRVFPSTTVKRYQFFGTQPSLVQLSHLYMTTEKTVALTTQIFVSKVVSLLFNSLSRFFIAFLPRSKCLLILWLQLPSVVILEPLTVLPLSPFYFPWNDRTGCHDLNFLNVEFYASFFALLFPPPQKAL